MKDFDLLNYNEKTGEFVWAQSAKSGHRVKGRTAGSKSSQGYIGITINNKWHFAHRIAWYKKYGALPVKEIDHINGDRSDNRICNLRLVNRFEQMRNRAPDRDKCVIFKGVDFDKTSNLYRARIKQKTIGKTKSMEHAAMLYDFYAHRQFGVHAYLNFPWLKGYYNSLGSLNALKNMFRHCGVELQATWSEVK